MVPAHTHKFTLITAHKDASKQSAPVYDQNEANYTQLNPWQRHESIPLSVVNKPVNRTPARGLGGKSGAFGTET